MEGIQVVAQFSALVACALFAGAALYISLVEHPARLECGTELASTVFGPSYRRAAVMQGSLAALGSVCAIASWLAGADVGWLMGAVLIVLVIPFTLVVIMPTNKELLSPTLDKASPEARALLLRWGKLHAVRSVLGLVALIILLAST